MAGIGGLLAYLDNLRRVGARNAKDMFTDPEATAEKIHDRQQEYWANPNPSDWIPGGKVVSGLGGVLLENKTLQNLVKNAAKPSPEILASLGMTPHEAMAAYQTAPIGRVSRVGNMVMFPDKTGKALVAAVPGVGERVPTNAVKDAGRLIASAGGRHAPVMEAAQPEMRRMNYRSGTHPTAAGQFSPSTETITLMENAPIHSRVAAFGHEGSHGQAAMSDELTDLVGHGGSAKGLQSLFGGEHRAKLNKMSSLTEAMTPEDVSALEAVRLALGRSGATASQAWNAPLDQLTYKGNQLNRGAAGYLENYAESIANAEGRQSHRIASGMSPAESALIYEQEMNDLLGTSRHFMDNTGARMLETSIDDLASRYLAPATAP